MLVKRVAATVAGVLLVALGLVVAAELGGLRPRRAGLEALEQPARQSS